MMWQERKVYRAEASKTRREDDMNPVFPVVYIAICKLPTDTGTFSADQVRAAVLAHEVPKYV